MASWVLAFLISFAVTAVAGLFLLPLLRKLKCGQTILQNGPSHMMKQGTPTIGGITFIIGSAAAVIAVSRTTQALAIIACGLLFGAVGFVDDYIKVVKKRNLGLTASKKFAAQFLVSLAFACVVRYYLPHEGVLIPFAGIRIDLGALYIPFAILVMLATTNSVNLTDGIDGLAASTSAIVALFFTVAATIFSAQGVAAATSAVAGGALAFLLYNFYPAKVFMGDTGSLFLGGILAAAAIMLGMELFLIISGFVFLFETLSVIIQVLSGKFRGKLVFKMAPFHHHLEKCGWRETKIVFVFSLITLALCALCYFGIGI